MRRRLPVDAVRQHNSFLIDLLTLLLRVRFAAR
jgi:hypothetical protein